MRRRSSTIRPSWLTNHGSIRLPVDDFGGVDAAPERRLELEGALRGRDGDAFE